MMTLNFYPSASRREPGRWPDLCVFNWMEVLTTHVSGGSGKLIRSQRVFAPTDAVVADIYGANLLGLRGEEILAIRMAHEHGMFTFKRGDRGTFTDIGQEAVFARARAVDTRILKTDPRPRRAVRHLNMPWNSFKKGTGLVARIWIR